MLFEPLKELGLRGEIVTSLNSFQTLSYINKHYKYDKSYFLKISLYILFKTIRHINIANLILNILYFIKEYYYTYIYVI